MVRGYELFRVGERKPASEPFLSALSLAVSWSAAGPSSSGTISSSENTFDWSEPFSDSSSFRLSAMRRTGADGLLDVFTIDGVCFRISILDLSRCEFTPYSSSLSVPVPSAISTPAS
ncbi:hypothetical protein OGAPHI_002422 [Ogataea philodendri]|uniref:Uncharacterized protein n=1 Tax=Ogataea philodendri TaxID=1378263 RepID=A0A9P8PAN0_9ASCO|nr:uncharacterized protein OGAPHI_002422 [Ogataea philodendri]KAH3668668.1 hypothetical protein OGAPHI_002422 [Ogataea philodendri]